MVLIRAKKAIWRENERTYEMPDSAVILEEIIWKIYHGNY